MKKAKLSGKVATIDDVRLGSCWKRTCNGEVWILVDSTKTGSKVMLEHAKSSKRMPISVVTLLNRYTPKKQ